MTASSTPPLDATTDAALALVYPDGHALAIPADRWLQIGRSVDKDVVCRAPTVSAVHAAVRRTATGLVLVRDLGSTNGTWLDGVRLRDTTEGTAGAVLSLGPEVHLRLEPARRTTPLVDASPAVRARLAAAMTALYQVFGATHPAHAAGIATAFATHHARLIPTCVDPLVND